MPRISIRHAKPDELSRIIFITKRAYKIPYKENTLVTKPHEPKDIKDRFIKKEFFIIAAVLNNKIVGAVRYKILEKNNLYFYQMAVLKTHRNKSVGASLVNEVEGVARKKGCNKILLDCAREKKLPEYYKKFGFKTDRTKKHLDHHDVYMSKKIKTKNHKKKTTKINYPGGK